MTKTPSKDQPGHGDKAHADAAHGRAADRPERETEAPRGLTQEDLALLQALEPATDAPSTARTDLLDLLADEETASALRASGAFFTDAGLPVAELVGALPQAIALKHLDTRFDVTRARLDRNRRKLSAPLSGLVLKLHGVIAGTPEGSPVRERFSKFLEQWDKIFPGHTGANHVCPVSAKYPGNYLADEVG